MLRRIVYSEVHFTHIFVTHHQYLRNRTAKNTYKISSNSQPENPTRQSNKSLDRTSYLHPYDMSYLVEAPKLEHSAFLAHSITLLSDSTQYPTKRNLRRYS